MTTTYLILGAGPVGQGVAALLVAQGAQVRLASRSGKAGPAGAQAVQLDATDSQAVTDAAAGAAALFNCLNPPDYHRWPQQWPPLAAAALHAARRTGATLVTASNLYPYGHRTTPITAATPENPAGTKGAVRAAMWADALAAHQAGQIRAVEVRSADYLGNGSFGELTPAVRAVARGRTAWVIGATDQPHSFAYVPDVARTLVAAAQLPAAWGRLWITPCAAALTAGEVLRLVSDAAGHPRVRILRLPHAVMYAGGWVSPLLRELRETASEREAPFTVDASETETVLGVRPTGWDELARALVAGS